MSRKRKFDKIFASLVAVLVLFGFFLFMSASLGLLAKDRGDFLSVFSKQVGLGLFGGLIILVILSKIHYKNYRKYAFYIFIGSLIVSSLVFVPKIGISHGGARRWLDIFGFSFQPAELLKISFVMYFAALLSSFKSKLHQWKYSIIPIMVLLSFVALLAFLQPDYGTFVIIGITAIGMIFVAGINLKHLSIIIGSVFVAIIPLALYKPYVIERIITFINPTQNSLSSGYQIKQSLIAIGSGGIFGKGFGKSIQKFGLLPEPMGDSIFAISAEEWGFIGALFLITLFLLFALRGLKIASHSTDVYGRLLAVGIVILIVSQSFINIASMLNIFPMIGMPLIFVSQGGTALLFALAEVGILLNISKYKKTIN
ncbi:MAG: FtsW/RodA/SpoVE family cell cycle protein [Candidatus Pacebacteria bacterium]|nr:FtsW/RodA/SpoVE family cell cycle protein [Candidatus Paceibacterota bacterium]